MEMNTEEKGFIAQRARLVRTWPFVGGVLLCLLLGFYLSLVVFQPLLANPFAVISRLKSASIPQATLSLMAALLPIVVSMCLFLVLVVILFCFVSFGREKKYIAIIQQGIEVNGKGTEGEGGESGS